MSPYRILLIGLLLLASAITNSVATAADFDREPRDYHIYLDYSASIVGPNKSNKNLADMMKALLEYEDDVNGRLMDPARGDKVTILRFGKDLKGDKASGWRAAIAQYGTATQGEDLTNFQAVVEDMGRRIRQQKNMTNENFHVQLFLT